ncbi:hydrolase [Bifidobacterium aquikefiri]|uniref:Hydrolase n=1 Tax=Bifidobacterium aquikefiri TaxID=1653207 RepID=A0A261G676_9BIFI|nr:hydrolase [Bifidobacterium aquikefiri]
MKDNCSMLNTNSDNDIENQWESIFKELISINTISGSATQEQALRVIADWLTQANCSVRVDRKTKFPFLYAHTSNSQARPVLFLAHIDTVPLNQEAWSIAEPTKPVEIDGKIYGRGTSDMKSGLVAGMIALAYAASHSRSAALIVTCDEELGCLGAPSAFKTLSELQPKIVIVAESTNMKAALGHRGAAWFSITSKGKSAHASSPQLGSNAICSMSKVIASLDSAPYQIDQYLGKETLSPDLINSGIANNIVPDCCKAIFDYRIVKENIAPMQDWFTSFRGISEVQTILRLNPVWTNPKLPLAHALIERFGLFGNGTVPYFTDASILEPATPKDCPIIVLGPGNPSVVHAADEFVESEQLSRACQAFSSIVAL